MKVMILGLLPASALFGSAAMHPKPPKQTCGIYTLQHCDVDGNGFVDIIDISLVGDHFGECVRKSCQP